MARVGDADIALADLRRSVALQKALAALQGGPCGQANPGESETSACSRQALSGDLLWLAVAGYADRNGLGSGRDEVEQAVSQLEAQVGTDMLNQALAKHDLKRKDLFELGRRILTIRAVRLAVAEERVGNQELKSLYDQRSLEFTILQVDHILVGTEAEARDAYERVKDASEAEFVALAKKISTEPGAKERGGQLGSAAATTFVPEFADAAAALQPGEVSQPVKTRFGWHVIYLVDKEVTPFADAKERLLEPLADREFTSWLEERARLLHVEVNPMFGRFVPSTFSVVAVRSTDPSDTAVPSP